MGLYTTIAPVASLEKKPGIDYDVITREEKSERIRRTTNTIRVIREWEWEKSNEELSRQRQ